ncbi:hypothetical protein EPN52_05910 [bacterium]|nr:MAG: hypothetical protein EPN52_05910 [bacterium]
MIFRQILIVLVASSLGIAPMVASAQGAATVKVGLIDTISGAFAQVGTDTQHGAQLAIDEINAQGGVAGHRFELVVKDEQLNPTATVQALRELQAAGINITMGYASSADCLAALPVAAQSNVLVMGSNCIATALTTTKFDKHFFRIAPSDAMLTSAAAQFAHEHFPTISTWDAYAPDYVTGHDDWNFFSEKLRRLSPSVQTGKAVFVPLAAQDVRSYVTALSSALPAESAKSHGLYLATFGGATAAVVKQGKPDNLFGKFAATINVGGSEPTAAQLGADFPDAWFVYDYYNRAYNTPMNRHFTAAYQKAYGDAPNSWSYEGYATIYALRSAIERSKSVDVSQIITALEQVPVVTPKGTLRYRPDHELAQPVTVFECKGDASAPKQYSCPHWVTVPAEKVAK